MPMFRSLLESDSTALNNVNIIYETNQLDDLQKSCQIIEGFKMIPQLVPVVPMVIGESKKYVMQLLDVKRLCEAEDCSVKCALGKMVETINAEGFDVTISDLAVCCKKEDIDSIAGSVNATNMVALSAALTERTSDIKAIKATGASVYMTEK